MEEPGSEALHDGLNTIESLCNALDISVETKETAEVIYREAVETDDVELVGRGVDAIAGSSLLIACRETGDVKIASEIADELGDSVGEKRIHRTTKYLCSKLGLGLVVADPHDFVDRISEILSASDQDTEMAKAIVDEVKDDGVAVNQAASSVAATAFYFVGAHDRGHGLYTQREVADAAGISTLTVRENYRDYTDVLSEEDISTLQISGN